MSRKRFTSLLLALVILGILVTPALAVPPGRLELPNNPTYEVADCGEFQVMNHEQSTLRLTLFYNTEGALVRANQYWSGTDYLTNSETGKVIASDFSNHAVYDFTTSTVKQSGIFWHATVPHYGPVFFQVGHVVGINFDDPKPEVTFNGVTKLHEKTLCTLLAD